MNLNEFVKKYNNEKIDFDNYAGFQCVDLFRQYSKDVNGTPHTGAVEGAKDLFLSYDKLTEEKKWYKKVTRGFKSGDVLVWDKTSANKYGHVAILLAEMNDDFIVFEQNGFTQDGAKINLRSKGSLLGALRRK